MYSTVDWEGFNVEDYYFPEQKSSRRLALEKQYGMGCEHLGEIPFSVPRSKLEVQELIRKDIKAHPQFIISGVTMNWDGDILSAINIVYILEAPAEERARRVQQREEARFGSRVMVGGDMYEQQQNFRKVIINRTGQSVEESASKMQCPKVRLDGMKAVNENVSIVLKALESMGMFLRGYVF